MAGSPAGQATPPSEVTASEESTLSQRPGPLHLFRGPKRTHLCSTNPLQGGLYYITKGHCAVKNSDDGYCIKNLAHGDCFGESELIKSVDYTFFGDIIAEDDVECFFLPRNCFHKIPYYEQLIMRQSLMTRGDISMLAF